MHSELYSFQYVLRFHYSIMSIPGLRIGRFFNSLEGRQDGKIPLDSRKR